jgi:glycosyltransferase involved in cell wall biosynthesis
MSDPLVTVVCLCYNHARFVEEAITSVLAQTHKNIQLVVVDDASNDGSQSIIKTLVDQYPLIHFISLTRNLGNCKAFNRGLKEVKGEFIIDFAADDVLLPQRIERGVKAFQKNQKWGVQFSDAELIDEQSRTMGLHSDRFPHSSIPQGDIYQDLIQKYFICSATMMFRKSVIDELEGYDESLHYEDFDFWVRSSRLFQYGYIPEVLVKRRIVKGSMSDNQFKRSSPQQESTLAVCKKVMIMNRVKSEQEALNHRVLYELFQSLKRFDFDLAWKYALLGRANSLRKL